MNQSEHEAKTRKRGKTHCPCQARENMQLVASAGKYVTSCKRGKMSAADWFEKTYNEL